MDLGLKPEEVDPCWDQAMMILKHALEETRSLMRTR